MIPEEKIIRMFGISNESISKFFYTIITLHYSFLDSIFIPNKHTLTTMTDNKWEKLNLEFQACSSNSSHSKIIVHRCLLWPENPHIENTLGLGTIDSLLEINLSQCFRVIENTLLLFVFASLEL